MNKMTFTILPTDSSYPPYWWQCVESRGAVNIERAHLAGMQRFSLKNACEDMVGRCAVLCLFYKIVNSTYNVTRTQIIVAFAYTLWRGLVFAVIIHEPAAVTTLERLIGPKETHWKPAWL